MDTVDLIVIVIPVSLHHGMKLEFVLEMEYAQSLKYVSANMGLLDHHVPHIHVMVSIIRVI